MTEQKKDKNKVAVYDESRLSKNANIGMAGVDPNDIRPPAILLAQALSDFDSLKTKDGVSPKVGQFFHTGKLEIYDSFECYFVFAAKSQYTDRRKPEAGPKDQYRALAVMMDDVSLFGMIFKGSATYAMSSLFGFVHAMKRPLFSVKCKVESKELSNKEGTWFVPVIRVLGPEKDQEKLVFLEDLAKQFDKKGIDEKSEDAPHPVAVPPVEISAGETKEDLPFDVH